MHPQPGRDQLPDLGIIAESRADVIGPQIYAVDAPAAALKRPRDVAGVVIGQRLQVRFERHCELARIGTQKVSHDAKITGITQARIVGLRQGIPGNEVRVALSRETGEVRLLVGGQECEPEWRQPEIDMGFERQGIDEAALPLPREQARAEIALQRAHDGRRPSFEIAHGLVHRLIDEPIELVPIPGPDRHARRNGGLDEAPGRFAPPSGRDVGAVEAEPLLERRTQIVVAPEQIKPVEHDRGRDRVAEQAAQSRLAETQPSAPPAAQIQKRIPRHPGDEHNDQDPGQRKRQEPGQKGNGATDDGINAAGVNGLDAAAVAGQHDEQGDMDGDRQPKQGDGPACCQPLSSNPPHIRLRTLVPGASREPRESPASARQETGRRPD